MSEPTTTPHAPAPVISLRGLRKSFGALKVLDGVDLDVLPAENMVVLGRSGTGKSVLIKLIVGLLEPDAGDIQVMGQSVLGLKRKQLDALRVRIGFSFQSSALYDSMDVAQNLEFPLTMNVDGLSTQEVRARVDAALEAVGLADSRRKIPAELSGGQRKRIGIARALILQPEIMLYDEPTAGLDPVTSGEINDLIRSVQATHHTSAILITHDLTCARAVGDRAAMLLDGRLTKPGTFAELFPSADPKVQAFYDYNFIQATHP